MSDHLVRKPGRALAARDHLRQAGEAAAGAVTPVRECCPDDRVPESHPGARLRRARLDAGLSLDDVARVTKIPHSVLRAIEATDVDHLPAAVYTRGFVKAFAREVKLDPAQTADEYLSAVLPADSGTSAETEARHGHRADDYKAFHEIWPQFSSDRVKRFDRLVVVAAAVGLVVYLVALGRAGSPGASVSNDPPAGAPAPSATNGDAVPAVASAGVPLPVPSATGAVRIELVVQGPCWIAADVDGQRVLYKLLQAGDRRTIDMNSEALLRVGDPSAVSMFINGAAVPSLGPAGRAVDLRITRDNYRTFIAS